MNSAQAKVIIAENAKDSLRDDDGDGISGAVLYILHSYNILQNVFFIQFIIHFILLKRPVNALLTDVDELDAKALLFRKVNLVFTKCEPQKSESK